MRVLSGAGFGLTVLLGGALAHPAAATPPDMLTVRDVLFGSTPNQVMVLRTTQDNLGQYYAEQRDTILIVIDRATGREQQYPVYRMRSEADFDIDPMGDRRIARAVPLANAVDPFALLTAAGGMPLIGDGDPPAEGWNTGTAADVDGVMVLTFADGRTARAPMAAILQQMDATLQTTAGVLGDYSRIAPIGTADLLSGRTHACRPISARRIDDRSGTAATAILRVDCEEDGDAGISLLTVLTMDSAADGSAAD